MHQKLKNKERVHGFFKKEIGLEIVGDGAGRERHLWRRGSDSLVRHLSSRIWGKMLSILASKCTTIMPRSGHDRTAIRPQSRRDRAMIVVLLTRRTPSNRVETIPRWRSNDRGSIAPRSRFDRAAIVEFFHRSSLPSDWNLTLQISSEKRRKSVVTWPLDRDRAV